MEDDLTSPPSGLVWLSPSAPENIKQVVSVLGAGGVPGYGKEINSDDTKIPILVYWIRP